MSVAEKFGLTKYMTIDEVCEYAKCSKRHLFAEIQRKNLKAHKPVREILFDPQDVQAWIKRKVK
jgi:excisionase family DNA binding protein